MKTNPFVSLFTLSAALILFIVGCNTAPQKADEKPAAQSEAPEYFMLRPDVEKAYGYSHAVRIGNELKISGAVSMDDKGNLTAKGDLGQQMKNCYADLDKILKHYGYTWNDVVVENILTTNMPEFVEQSAYRNTIYKKQFPTGSWFGVKELALPGQLIEIELEAYKVR
ncbi:RidA family protein [Fibrella arboris]|uniref:RidA family protein n=1 Tax=Fibrella arboris TaxID=3242486 RepID=UPI00351F81F3